MFGANERKTKNDINPKEDETNPTYVNSWENVKAYAQFILSSNSEFYNNFINTFGLKNQEINLLPDQEKIIKLNKWIDEQLNLAARSGSSHPKTMRGYDLPLNLKLSKVSDYHRPLARLKKFINNQVERIEAHKQVDFIIKNSYSKISKKLKRNFLENIGVLFTNKQIDNEKTRLEMVKNHVNSISPQYSRYARFNNSITNLKGLSEPLFQSPKQYQTEINWGAVHIYIQVALQNSRTQQTRHRAKILNKLINIIRSGASDSVKINSLFYFLQDSMREMKDYKRLSASLREINNMLWPVNNKTLNLNFYKNSTNLNQPISPLTRT